MRDSRQAGQATKMRAGRDLIMVILGLAIGIPLVAFASALEVMPSGDVGIGTDDPQATLHVEGDDQPQILVERTGAFGEGTLFKLKNDGTVNFELANGTNRWSFGNTGKFRVNAIGTGMAEIEVSRAGDMELRGTLEVGGLKDASASGNVSVCVTPAGLLVRC